MKQINRLLKRSLTALTGMFLLFPAVGIAQEDVTRIRDLKAREAVAAIQEKLADVTDYSCQAEFAGAMPIGKPGKQRRVEYLARSEIKFKRPNLGHHRLEDLKHPSSFLDGSILETYYDNVYWWQYRQHAPDYGEKVADAKKMPPGFDRNLYVEQLNEPKIYRYELKAFADAGLEDRDGSSADVLLNPFNESDLESLTLVSEDDQVWVFTAKPRRVNPLGQEYTTIRHTIGKADGVVRETFYDGGEELTRTVTISGVKLNPRFDISVFQFTPPENIEIYTDGTEKMVRSLVRQREEWEKQHARANPE